MDWQAKLLCLKEHYISNQETGKRQQLTPLRWLGFTNNSNIPSVILQVGSGGRMYRLHPTFVGVEKLFLMGFTISKRSFNLNGVKSTCWSFLYFCRAVNLSSQFAYRQPCSNLDFLSAQASRSFNIEKTLWSEPHIILFFLWPLDVNIMFEYSAIPR